MSSPLRQYIELIESFIQNKIEAIDFERRYLDLFKADTTEWSEAEFAILDELFAAVDAFCADPTLRDAEDLDEEQLRRKCRAALEKLRALDTQKFVKSGA